MNSQPNVLNAINTEQWVELVEQELQSAIQEFEVSSMYVPAGNTPKPLYEKWRHHSPNYLEGLRLLQIDEILQPGQIFQNFFKQELLNVKDVEPFHQGNTQGDCALLGLGLNGHVGFHEPHIPLNFYSGCVPLTETTKQALNLQGEIWGSTYGVGAFLSCKKIFLLVRGEAKQNILKYIISERPDLPATPVIHSPKTTIINLRI